MYNCLCIKLLSASLATALLSKSIRGCQHNLLEVVLIHNSFARMAFFIKKCQGTALTLKPFALQVQARLRLDGRLLWAENPWVIVNAAWNKKQSKKKRPRLTWLTWKAAWFSISRSLLFVHALFPLYFFPSFYERHSGHHHFSSVRRRTWSSVLLLLSIMKLTRCVIQCRKKRMWKLSLVDGKSCLGVSR